MRLFYFTDVYPKLSETFVSRELSALRARGVELALMALRPGQDPVRHEIAFPAGLEVHYRDHRPPGRAVRAGAWLAAFLRSPARFLDHRSAAGLPGLPESSYAFRQAPWTANRVRRHGAERIHGHFGRQGLIAGWLAGRLLGLPVSVTLHGSDLQVDPYPGLDRVLADLDHVVCVSRALRDRVVERHGVPASRTSVIHCGIDPERFGGAAATRERSREELRLLFVGRLHPVKGLTTLIDACAELASRQFRFACTLVGEGEQRAELERRVGEAGLGQRVRFVGAVANERLAAVYADHDLFVLPSLSEGISVVAMEAMASGLPVVATRVGGMAELIDDGDHGRLVEPGDVPALARAIEEVAEIWRREPERSERSRARIREQFDLRTETDKLLHLFRRLSGGSASSDTSRSSPATRPGS